LLSYPEIRQVCEQQPQVTRTEMRRAGVVRALAGAPNWLAAESVSAAMAAASLQDENARAMPMPNNE